MHDRLRRHGFISRPIYDLPLTQKQIADHVGLTLVHVNRTLRRLREHGIVLFDRHVVSIADLDRLRQFAGGLRTVKLPTEAAVRAEPLSAGR